MGRHSADNGVVLQSYKRDGTRQDSDSDHSHVKHGKHKGKPGKIRVGKPLPQASSNILSLASIWWLTPLVYHISRTVQTGLGDEAVWSCAPVDGCQENAKWLNKIWQRELEDKGRANASFFRCCVNFVRPMMWRLMITAALFASSLNVLSVVVFSNIVKYLQDEKEDLYFGLALVGCMFALNMVQLYSFGYVCALGTRYGTRVKGATMYLAYEKTLKIENVRKNTMGVLVSLFSADSQRIYLAVYRLYTVAIFLTILTAGIIATSYLIGWWSLISVLIFALTTLIQMLITKISAKLTTKRLRFTDSRIQKMKEVLSSIRLIKMWAWEKPFVQEIIHEREQETSKAYSLTFWTTLMISQVFQTPTLATAVTLTLYSYFGNPLDTQLAFSVATTLSTMRYALAALPLYGRYLSDGYVSCKRLQALLLRQEKTTPTDVVRHEGLAVELRAASFQWPSEFTSDVPEFSTEKDSSAYSNPVMESETRSNNIPNGHMEDGRSPSAQYALWDISFEAEKGTLIGVCGRVGSGKSALISALLGQMTKVDGSIAVNGTVAICPQEAWIFNDTVRENILFGNPYNKERYDRVLELTSFQTDLIAFPSGDQSEIGDRGINLSGGQRQRLSLARALYSDRDVYLLDDPLSALDVTVGQQVFSRCIKEGLRDKTVILTTHQLQYLQACDQVVFLEDGTVSEIGNHAELMAQDKEYSYLIRSFYEKTSTKNSRSQDKVVKTDDRVLDLHTEDAEAGRLTEKEAMGVGNVTFASYAAYIRCLGGVFVAITLVVVFMLSEGLVWGCDWWLSAWLQQIDSPGLKAENVTTVTGDFNTKQPTNGTVADDTDLTRVVRSLAGVSGISIHLDQSTFIMVYGVTVITLILCNFFRSWILAKSTIRGSRVIHRLVLEKVMASPVSFFDKTPLGRIMNRFSADMNMLDTLIPVDSGACMMIFFRVFLAVASIAAIFPLLLVTLIPIGVAIVIIGRLGRAACRQMKRMDNVSRSKLVDHVTSTVQGLTSVRTYNKEAMFRERLVSYMDTNSVRYQLYESSVDWTVSRSNFAGITLNLVTGIFVLLFRGYIPAQLSGLALSMVIQATTMMGPLIQQFCQFEAQFTSVERLGEYISDLKPEGHQKMTTTSVGPDWPRSGDVKFKDVCMAYDTNNKLVLKKVSFSVTSGQKIGIVGRTGAGKSSLGSALFRLVELSSGSILIDGEDISQLNLQQLRSKLSVIPQEPVLFAGSLRRNLDPFNNCKDEDIWVSLEKSQLKDKVLNLAGQLEYYVENNGENFSVGERQLLCMTRALLRKTPVLLLDEATASVDTETDSKIQMMVKDSFEDRTVLIIAHRLNTVEHCDKILVMDQGTVHEFDSPENLMRRPGSKFRSMVESSGV